MTNYHAPAFMQTPSTYAATDLFAQADVTPADIDCAQFYDAFTPLITLSLEEYGFCKPGEGGPFCEDGRLEWPDGEYRFKDAMEGSWRHVNTHLERDLKGGRLRPETRWTLIWGLALSANQTHSAIALLLAERNRPNTLPLQASILVRSLVEALGNLMALAAGPSAFRWFAADGYRRRFEQLRLQRKLFGHRAKWKEWLDQMDAFVAWQGEWARLGTRRRRRPTQTIPEWPTAYFLTRRQSRRGRRRPLPALLKGNRARLFEEAYRLWYSLLSSYAHQRSAAAQIAIFSNDPDAHWERGGIESDVMSQAMLFYACILSELESAARMPQSLDLRVLWSLLWDIDEHAQRFIGIRYRRLLRLPPFEQASSATGRL